MEAVSAAPSLSMKWYDVLREVLLHPSEKTFTRILDDPAASPKRAFLWVAVIGLVSGILGAATSSETTLLGRLPALILSPVIAIVGLVVLAFLLRLFARRYKGQGTFNQMAYVMGAIEASYGLIFSILATVLASLGIVGALVQLAFGLFMIYLAAQAIKAVEKFSIQSAYWTLILPLLLFAGLAICYILSLAILGPSLGAVFPY